MLLIIYIKLSVAFSYILKKNKKKKETSINILRKKKEFTQKEEVKNINHLRGYYEYKCIKRL